LQGAGRTGPVKVARMDARRDNEQEQSGRFQQAMWRTSNAPLRHGNEIGLLKNGPATYEDWLAAIGGARRWVHLENYIFADDSVGCRFADALSEKAGEGVPVRVLYDWYGCTDVWVPNSFWRKLRSTGVEVRVVNPPSLYRGVRRFLERDHRKLVGVDGLYASLGGICIADGWLERSSETGLIYRDTAAKVRGPAVADVERAFAGVWDLHGDPLPEEERPDAAGIGAVGEKATRVVIQEPGRARVLRTLEILLAAADRRMWIADAYFLSAPTLTQALISAARDGLDVRILLPATNDVRWVGALSRAGYRPLLEAGVRIFEYGGPMMHAKTHVVDGKFSRVGSTNLNFSGLLANWEADLMVEDLSFGAQMDEMFEEDLENAREVRLLGGTLGARRPKPTPEREIGSTERRDARRARRGSLPASLRGSSGAAPATVSRVGGEAFRSVIDGASLEAHERRLGAAVSAGVLGLSLLAARHPRLLAWPQAAAGILAGGLGLLRAARRGSPEVVTRDAPDRREG
jgi:cardiolipin synthase A/B